MPAYVALDDRLLVVDHRADPPTASERLRDHEPECVAVPPSASGSAGAADSPARVFVGTFDAGLHRSTDGGRTFSRVGADAIASDSVTAVAVSPHDPDVVWVGTEPSRIYRSTDGGRTFEPRPGLTDLPSAADWSFPPRPDTHHVRWIEPDPGDPDHWYVGIEAGALIQTHDAGATWEDRVAGSRVDNHTIRTHPDAPDRVYAAAGDGYAESHDAGETWTHPQEGLAHRYVWGLAVDPGDPDLVVASAASGASAAHRRGEAYLYRKRRGSAWERIGDPEADREAADTVPVGEGTYRAILAGRTEGGELWAVHDHGLYRSTDAGDTWNRIDVEWPSAYGDAPPRALAVG